MKVWFEGSGSFECFAGGVALGCRKWMQKKNGDAEEDLIAVG